MSQQSSIAALARRHLLFGLTLAMLGMALGIYMSVSQDHGQRPTHVHTLLVGFVVSVLYAVMYRIWLSGTAPKLATIQTWLHQVGAVIIIVGLFLVFGKFAAEAKVGPVLGLGSILVLAGAIIMFVQVWRAPSAE